MTQGTPDPTPLLLSTVVPLTQRFVVDGYRVFVTSVEFWTDHTGIRVVWPVKPSIGLEEYWSVTVRTARGGALRSKWSVGAVREHSDMYVITPAPIPLDAHRIDLLLAFGDIEIPLPAGAAQYS